MKQVSLLIFIILAPSLYSQELNMLNLAKYDNQWYHFGFTLGLMSNNLKIDYNDYQTSEKKVQSMSTPGFNVGIICDVKVLKNINIRFTPSLTFTQRDLSFILIDNHEIIKSVENSNLDLPLLIKYRANRYGNIRPYFLLGSKFTYDMASKKEVEDINLFKLDDIDYGLEFGFGIDIYLPYFKLSPELKYFYGLNNLLKGNQSEIINNELINSNLEALYSRSLLFSLTFE